MAKKQYGCPVEVTLDLIGGKWKCVILWWLRRGPKRFGELMQLLSGISQKVLTTQLRELEGDGLISRQVFPESPPRVEYSLTTYGETLRPITELMCDWGKTHDPDFQFGLMCLRGLRILAIANDLINQQLEAELRDVRGADVMVSPRAIALQDLQDANPDIVLIDFSLDDDFYSFYQHLKEVATNSPTSIPTIALTANDQERLRASAQGFRIHLMEPIDVSELVAAIANLTGRLE